jgi:hypothetical protein
MLRTKQNEPQYIMDWINSQSNFSKSIRHLIEKDVAENGIRDLKEEMMYKQIHPGASQGSINPVADYEHNYNLEIDNRVENSAVEPSKVVRPASSTGKEEEISEVQAEKTDYAEDNVSESPTKDEIDEITEGNKDVPVNSDSAENDHKNLDKKKPKKVSRNLDVSNW